jgi:hypothetical protein
MHILKASNGKGRGQRVAPWAPLYSYAAATAIALLTRGSELVMGSFGRRGLGLWSFPEAACSLSTTALSSSGNLPVLIESNTKESSPTIEHPHIAR